MKFTLCLGYRYISKKEKRPIDVPAKEFYERCKTYRTERVKYCDVDFDVDFDNIYTLMDVIKKYKPPYKRGAISYFGYVVNGYKDYLEYEYIPAFDKVNVRVSDYYPLCERTTETKTITLEGKPVVLQRIVAVRDEKGGDVTFGQKGGWVDSETEIGRSVWIGDDCVVVESDIYQSSITGTCIVCRSTIDHYSKIEGNVAVFDSTLHEATVSDNVTIINSTASGNYADNVLLYNVNDSNHDDEHDMYYGTKLCGNEVLAKFDGDEGLAKFLDIYKGVKAK